MARTQVTRQCAYCGKTFTNRFRGNGTQQIHCSRSCKGLTRSREVTAQFWSRVNKNGPIPAHRPTLGACWLWMGHRNKNGYGTTQRQLAHRLAWKLICGPFQVELMVLHACDMPSCVRPDHLSLGTPFDNMYDAVSKGRMAHGLSHYLTKRALASRTAQSSTAHTYTSDPPCPKDSTP